MDPGGQKQRQTISHRERDYPRKQQRPQSIGAERLPQTTGGLKGASSAHGSNETDGRFIFCRYRERSNRMGCGQSGIGGTTSAGLVSLIPYVEQLQPDALVCTMDTMKSISCVNSTSSNLHHLKCVGDKKSTVVFTLVYLALQSATQSGRYPNGKRQRNKRSSGRRVFNTGRTSLFQQYGTGAVHLMTAH